MKKQAFVQSVTESQEAIGPHRGAAFEFGFKKFATDNNLTAEQTETLTKVAEEQLKQHKQASQAEAQA